MATNYSRGRAFEYRVRDDFKKRGYLVVRAAQSKGPADLVVIPPWPGYADSYPPVTLIQCKRDGRVSKAEREKLLDLLRRHKVAVLLAKAGPNGRGIEYENLSLVRPRRKSV